MGPEVCCYPMHPKHELEFSLAVLEAGDGF